MFYSFSILLVKRTDRLIFGRQISNTRGGESFFFALTRCFWSDRAFIISALNKKIWSENVLKPLLKQAYYLICASYIQRCDLWIQPIPFCNIKRLLFLFSPKRPRIRFHDLCNPQTFPAEKLFDFFVCATSFSREKKRKKILVFSLLLPEFRNVKNEMLC